MKQEKTDIVSQKSQRAAYIIADYITASIAFAIFNLARYYISDSYTGYVNFESFIFSSKLLFEQAIIPFLLLGVYGLSGYYNNPLMRSRIEDLVMSFEASCINTAIIYLALFVNEQGIRKGTHYEIVLILFGLLFILTYIGRFIVTTHIFYKIRSRKWRFNTIIVGNSRKARAFADKLAKSQSIYGYRTIGFLELEHEKNVRDNHKIFSFENLEDIIRTENVMQFIIVPEHSSAESEVLKLLEKLFPLKVPIKVAADTFSYISAGIRTQDIFGEPLIEISSNAINDSTKNIKRVFDIIASLITLIILALPMGIVALLVKKDSPGPVFYSQMRVGRRNRLFKIYKFRTMFKDAEKSGPCLSSPGDTRITKLGRVLRKYRIDELPQFWNVLKGDMSLVGPRPERPFYIDKIVKQAPYYTLLHQVRPGITSWGMVKYGYAQNIEEMMERSRYDLLYLSNMSLSVDLKIMIFTVKTVITGRGM